MDENTQHPSFFNSGAETNIAMMICTAGHVDHGKTKLVKLLTGCNTDRLKIEQERGLTIELGFAPCILDRDIGVGIVDVPGHEKFIRNMVAGVSGIEMVILVIAANDGIMPQTIEHFRIMEFMGITQGIVAVTKTDMVSKERVTEVISEISEFLKGTFMENAPVCPVSSETFDGYTEFYGILSAQVKKIEKKKRFGVFRMPVEQVFSQKGHGMVVMGIPMEGSIEIGDQVELIPGGKIGKVRRIQQFLQDTEKGEYGQCLALNIPDFIKNPPVRGQVICLPGYINESGSFHVRINSIPDLKHPLKNAEEIKFHTGTAESNGKLYLLENKTLEGGETALASIVLNEPVAAAAQDKFIIRRSSPPETVAGGEVLGSSISSEKPRKRQVLELIRDYESFMENTDPSEMKGLEKRIEYCLLLKRMNEVTIDEISINTLLPKNLVGDVLSVLKKRGNVCFLGADTYIHVNSIKLIVEEIVNKLFESVSLERNLTFSHGDLQQGHNFSPRLWKLIEDELLRKGVIILRGNTFVVNEKNMNLSENDRMNIDTILKIYGETEFRSPRPAELPMMINSSEKTIEKYLEYLYACGLLIRLDSNVVLSRDAFIKAQDIVVKQLKDKEKLDSADFKYSIETSRKYALAILDHLDALHITFRSGNFRSLSPDYERRMIR
jgi:selenocysteine-specific elongation factor